MEEKWKPIPGFEGLYEASTEGRIRSVDKIIKMYHGGEWVRKGDIRTPTLNHSGYLRLSLCKGGVQYPTTVHRLIAKTWLENPKNFSEVNHKNENKTDNRVSNLEWCSRDYNISYGTARKRAGVANGRPVIQYTLGGDKIQEFYSGYEAQRRLGVLEQNINLCCLGKRQQAGGFRWKYADDRTPFQEYRPNKSPVLQKKNGKIIGEFTSITEAYEKTGINNIGACCRGIINKAGGYQWEYLNEV